MCVRVRIYICRITFAFIVGRLRGLTVCPFRQNFVTMVSHLTNFSFPVDQQQGEMAALESGGGFNQKRNTNSQVG